MANEHDVFISHSHTEPDADWVERFAQALRDRGVGVWLDTQEVRPGESLPDSIEKALRGSSVIVAVIDAESAASPWVSFEIGAALGMGKRLIAVVPAGVPAKALPHAIRTRRFVLRNDPEETAIQVASAVAFSSEAASKTG